MGHLTHRVDAQKNAPGRDRVNAQIKSRDDVRTIRNTGGREPTAPTKGQPNVGDRKLAKPQGRSVGNTIDVPLCGNGWQQVAFPGDDAKADEIVAIRPSDRFAVAHQDTPGISMA
jgi:hypothetical protein